MVVKIFLSLLAKTLENILYKTLQRLIRRHSWTCSRFETWEMRVMKVWLTGWGEYMYSAKTKPIGKHHDQLYSKSADKGGIPSGPRALRGAICWSAWITPHSKNLAKRVEFISLVITQGIWSKIAEDEIEVAEEKSSS